MKVLIASDLHFEFHRDGGGSMLESMADADVFVCAGDLSDSVGIKESLEIICRKYPHVVFVAGNHEFYGSSIPGTKEVIAGLEKNLTNLHYLDNNVCEIEGRRFVGSTLWFRKVPGIKEHQPRLNDFYQIWDSEGIYLENDKALAFLEQEVTEDSIVVTHHLPSHLCVDPKYVGSPLNMFFVCDVESLIRERQPRFWIHGHTHETVDLNVGNTRVICNPFGYVNRQENQRFREDFIIEV